MADHPTSFATDRLHPSRAKVWRGTDLESFELGWRAQECLALQSHLDHFGLVTELGHNLGNPERWQ